MIEDTITTNQMPLACYLRFRGHEILSVDWDAARCSWTFPASARDDVSEYEQGKARVDPLAYFVSISEFKRQTWNSNPLRNR